MTPDPTCPQCGQSCYSRLSERGLKCRTHGNVEPVWSGSSKKKRASVVITMPELEQKFQCKLCDKEVSRLKAHLKRAHPRVKFTKFTDNLKEKYFKSL